MKPIVNIYKLGRLPYVEALKVQQVLFDILKKNVTSSFGISKQNYDASFTKQQQHQLYSKYALARNSLILVEHEPVYTIGIRSKNYDDNYVMKLKKELDSYKLKADFVHTNRGGLITFHGPGQLVAYPIIYLGDFTKTIQNRSVRAYVNLLETTIIDTLSKVGINGAHTVQEYPGVWLNGGDKKIAFIGISCKRYVTMHGVSINCDCNLSWFDHIVSCGIEDKSITSIHQELLLANNGRRQEVAQQNNKQQHLLNQSIEKFNTHDMLHDGAFSDRCTISSFTNQGDGGLSNDAMCSNSRVDYVSKAFCQSFSQHFDCNLKEVDFDLPKERYRLTQK